MEVSLDRTAGSRAEIEQSFESYDPLRDRAMRPTPLPGVRADHDRLRQVLHLLHRPIGARARAEPPGRARSRPRCASWPDEGCREITLAGPDRQQLPPHGRRPHDPACRTCSSGCTRSAGIDRIKFVTNYPKDMTDDLLQAVRDLPKCSHYLHVPCQSGSNEVLRRMKRGYTVESIARCWLGFARRSPTPP